MSAEAQPISGLRIPGLPEGLHILRYGEPAPGEAYVGHDGRVRHCEPNDRPGKALIVEAAPGWKLRWLDDFHAYEIYAPFSEPRRLFATIVVTDSAEEEKTKRALRAIPGLVSITAS